MQPSDNAAVFIAQRLPLGGVIRDPGGKKTQLEESYSSKLKIHLKPPFLSHPSLRS